MAEFNPQISDVSADYTSASQGVIPKGKAFGALFEGLAQMGEGLIANKQNQTADAIQKDVTSGVDKIFEDFKTPDSPTELKSFEDRMSLLKKAYTNGTLKESDYYIKIQDLSKQVRSRYPNYTDEVDRIISSTLGTNTANDLHKQLFREWEEEANISNQAEVSWENYKNQAAKDGVMPADYLDREASGNPYPKAELKMKIQQRYMEDAKSESRKKELELLDSENNATKTQILEAANEEAAVMSRRMIEDGMSGFSGERILAIMKEFAGKPIPDDVRLEIENHFQVFRGEAILRFRQRMSRVDPESGFSYMGKLGKDFKEVEATFMGTIDSIEKWIYDGNTGLLSSMKRMNESQAQSDLGKVLGSDAGVAARRLRAITEAYGDAAGPVIDKFFLQGQLPELQKAFADIMKLDILDPKKKSIKDSAIEIDGKVKGKLTPQVMDMTVQDAVRLLTDPETTPELSSQAAKMLYSPDNHGFLNLWKSPDKKMGVFMRMVQPEVTKKILASEDPTVFENYRNWTLNAFQALFKQEADTVMDAHKFRDTIKFEYNVANKQFVATVDQKLQDDLQFGARQFEAWRNSIAKNSMDKINKYIKLIDPILGAEGQDTTQTVQALFELMGVPTEQLDEKQIGYAHPYSFLGTLSAAIKGAQAQSDVFRPLTNDRKSTTGDKPSGVAPGFDKGSEVKPLSGQTIKAVAAGGEGKLVAQMTTSNKLSDFIGNAEGADYNTLSGGRKVDLSNFTVAEVMAIGDANRKKGGGISSSVGKGQFLKKTLQTLVKKGVISADDSFTPELQEKIIQALIDDRVKGAGSPEEAAYALSQEWASLPAGPDGKSYYAGDGTHGKTRVKWDDLINILKSGN